VAAEPLRIDGASAESVRDALERAGWASGRVLRACVLRQGHSPTMTGAILLYGLIRLFFSPGSKALPRIFVLAATSERVLAFRARGGVGGEGYRVTVYPGEEASWAREAVTMEAAKAGITMNAVLSVPGDGGAESIRCTAPNSQLEPAVEEMLALLGAPEPS